MVTQGNITFCVAATAKSQPHIDDSPLALAQCFPKCDLSCALYPKNLFQRNRFESTAVSSNQFDSRVFLEEANKSASVTIDLLAFPASQNLGKTWSLWQSPEWVFQLISFNFTHSKDPQIPRNLASYMTVGIGLQAMPSFNLNYITFISI